MKSKIIFQFIMILALVAGATIAYEVEMSLLQWITLDWLDISILIALGFLGGWISTRASQYLHANKDNIVERKMYQMFFGLSFLVGLGIIWIFTALSTIVSTFLMTLSSLM